MKSGREGARVNIPKSGNLGLDFKAIVLTRHKEVSREKGFSFIFSFSVHSIY